MSRHFDVARENWCGLELILFLSLTKHSESVQAQAPFKFHDVRFWPPPSRSYHLPPLSTITE